MISRQKALALRRLIEKAAISLPDEDALEAVELYPVWAADTAYDAGIRVRYVDKLYRCEQGHTSQDGWKPPDIPALWTDVAKPGEIPVWRQPTGAQDAYNTGDLVHYPDANGPVYRSAVDGNVWPPDTVSGIPLWEEVTAND